MDYTNQLNDIIFLLKSIVIGIAFCSAFIVMKFIIHAKNQKHLFIFFAFLFLAPSSFADDENTVYKYTISFVCYQGKEDDSSYTPIQYSVIAATGYTGTENGYYSYLDRFLTYNRTEFDSYCTNLNNNRPEGSFYTYYWETVIVSKVKQTSGGGGTTEGGTTEGGTTEGGTTEGGTTEGGTTEGGTTEGGTTEGGTTDEGGTTEGGTTEGSTINNYYNTTNNNTYNTYQQQTFASASLPSTPSNNSPSLSGKSIDLLRLRMAVNFREWFKNSGSQLSSITVPIRFLNYNFDQTINLVPLTGSGYQIRIFIRILCSLAFIIMYVYGIVLVLRQY